MSEYYRKGRRVTCMKWQETKKNRGRRSRRRKKVKNRREEKGRNKSKVKHNEMVGKV